MIVTAEMLIRPRHASRNHLSVSGNNRRYRSSIEIFVSRTVAQYTNSSTQKYLAVLVKVVERGVRAYEEHAGDVSRLQHPHVFSQAEIEHWNLVSLRPS